MVAIWHFIHTYIPELCTHRAIDGEGGERIAQRQQVEDVAQIVVDMRAELLREHSTHYGPAINNKNDG